MATILQSVTEFFIIYLALGCSVQLRSLVQVVAAILLGDATPYRRGRLTLNPFRHFHLMRSLLAAVGNEIVLWPMFAGRETPLDPRRWEKAKPQLTFVFLIGPIACIALSLVFTRLYILGYFAGITNHWLGYFVIMFRLTLLAVGLFHLLPLAPLDGYKAIAIWKDKEVQLKMAKKESEAPLYHGGGLLLIVVPIYMVVAKYSWRWFA